MAKAGKKPQKPEHRLRQKTPSTTKPEKKQKDKKEKIDEKRASEASRGRSKEKAPCAAVVPRAPQNEVREHGSPTSSQVRNIAELMETKKVAASKGLSVDAYLNKKSGQALKKRLKHQTEPEEEEGSDSQESVPLRF